MPVTRPSQPEPRRRPRAGGIARPFMIGLVAIVGLLTAIGISGALTLRDLAQRERALAEHVMPRLQSAQRVAVDAMAAIELTARLGSSAERRTAVDQVEGRLGTLARHMDALEAHGMPPEGVAAMRKARNALLDGALAISALVDEELQARAAGVPPAPLLARRKRNLLEYQSAEAQRLVALATGIATDAERAMATHVDATAERAEHLLALSLAGTAVAVVSLLAFRRAFRRRVLSRLLALHDAMVDWRSGRPVDTTAEAAAGPRRDEITAMREALTDLLSEVDARASDLRHLAQTDSLTGLANRRHFLALADMALKRADRSAEPVTVLVGDVDHFKQVNDEHGHAVGDAALRLVADLWAAHLREIDLTGRWGGEEFIALLPAATASQAAVAAERIREAVEASVVPAGGGVVGMGISVGIAQRRPAESFDALVLRADTALYEAKRAGRNRFVLAP